MSQLILVHLLNSTSGTSNTNEKHYILRKALTTIGTERTQDVLVSSKYSGVCFSLLKKEAGYVYQPGQVKVRINGKVHSSQTPLRSCDQLEWDDYRAVFIESDLPIQPFANGAALTQTPSTVIPTLEILQEVTSILLNQGDPATAHRKLLEALVEHSGAENGYLLLESGTKKGWQIQAQTANATDSSRSLYSNSILNEALRTRQPIYIDNIIGNVFAEAESVLMAKIFSVACFPLIAGDRVLGAVLLQTHAPGHIIRKNALPVLSVLASQAVFLLLCSSELSTTRMENTRLKATVSPSGKVLTTDPVMLSVQERIQKLAPSSLAVLISGETGTGKELVAEELHSLSPRAKGPFVAVNCAAIPETLLESILFGHERGAFTGAVKNQIGKFEQANGGTLFLDEIGDIPLNLQAKLLRVLQEKKVEPLGSGVARSIDVRIVCATHRKLEDLAKKGEFRQDLYFRLAGATVSLPPLRSRKKDIVPLANHFLYRQNEAMSFSESAIGVLLSHPWPGNIRELEQLVSRVAVLAQSSQIEASDLELEAMELPADQGEERSFWDEYPTLDSAQQNFTRRYVQRILDKSEGNRGTAATLLGVSERTLYRILAEAPSNPGSSDSTGRKS